MTPINGRIQREGEAAHLMARQLLDLITDLSVPADRHAGFRLSVGTGDGFPRGGGPDPRDWQKPVVRLRELAREI